MHESEKRCESEKEKHLLIRSGREETRKPYMESYQRAIHLLLDEGKQDAAEAVMVNETQPALLTYHAAWDEFVEFQENQVDASSQKGPGGLHQGPSPGVVPDWAGGSSGYRDCGVQRDETAREMAGRIDAKNEVSRLNASLEARVIRRTGEVREANKRLNLQVAALEAAANAIVITDSHGTIVWVNHAFTTMTGYSKEEVLGKNPRLLKSGDQPASYYAKLWSTISSGKVWQGEIVNRRKDGTAYTEEMTITPVTPERCRTAIHTSSQSSKTSPSEAGKSPRNKSNF